MAMPFAVGETVIVYRPAVISLFSDGEEVYRWHKPLLRAIKLAAEAAAPVGPPRWPEPKVGRNLKYSHGNTGSLRSNPLRRYGSIYNTAPYAEFVHNGTHGPIRPHGKTLKIPSISLGLYRPNLVTFTKKAGMAPFTHLGWVRGQKSNPWMHRAARLVLAPYGVHLGWHGPEAA